MKKRKVNPSSNVAKVLDLMKADSNISVKEIVAKTGLATKNVYVIRNYIKKHKLLKSLPMTGIAPKVKRADTVSAELVKKAVVKLNQEIQAKDQHITSLQTELNRVRHMYMDQLAVVRYLEVKLMQFVETNLSERN